jgi:Ser/Thr protein kinase RdoA (MazF antagonist)
MGEVYRLTAPGRTLAAKRLVRPHGDDDRLRGEIAFADSCRRAGVRSPVTLVGADGDPLYVDPESGDRWRLQEWVVGVVPEPTDVRAAVWVADQLAIIHRLGLAADPDGFVTSWFGRVADSWEAVVAAALGAATPWAPALAARADEFRALAAMVDGLAIGHPVLCHRDALAGNTIEGADGTRWLIDWDNYGALESWRELGVLLLRHVDAPLVVAEIADRYRRSCDLAFPTGVELFATGIAVWLNHVQEKALEAVDPAADAADREYASRRVTDLVTGIPGMAELEAAALAVKRRLQR